jgi:hypothetical protein
VTTIEKALANIARRKLAQSNEIITGEMVDKMVDKIDRKQQKLMEYPAGL